MRMDEYRGRRRSKNSCAKLHIEKLNYTFLVSELNPLLIMDYKSHQCCIDHAASVIFSWTSDRHGVYFSAKSQEKHNGNVMETVFKLPSKCASREQSIQRFCSEVLCLDKEFSVKVNRTTV